jgi:hypothetical protein
MEIEVAPGVLYPAWTYNGQVPGPTLRATEGDRLRGVFLNAGTHAHTIHFHGIHPSGMDGVYEVVNPGERFIYEFTARPAGLQLYHCHAIPLKRHIAKGLYGTLIIDPALFHRGDPDGDGRISILDALQVFLFLFIAGPAPACFEAADFDDDGRIDASDPILILRWLFLNGTPPRSPGAPSSGCGPDPVGSPYLGCGDYPAC